jgi:hypothetical protein
LEVDVERRVDEREVADLVPEGLHGRLGRHVVVGITIEGSQPLPDKPVEQIVEFGLTRIPESERALLRIRRSFARVLRHLHKYIRRARQSGNDLEAVSASMPDVLLSSHQFHLLGTVVSQDGAESQVRGAPCSRCLFSLTWSRGDSKLCPLPCNGGTILCWRLMNSENACNTGACYTWAFPEFSEICPWRNW